MTQVNNKRVLVVGLGASGRAAAALLARRGARVTAVDGADTPALRQAAEGLRAQGIAVQLGAKAAPAGEFDLAVISPGIARQNPLVSGPAANGTPVIGELEFGYQQSACPNVAITGTNGKTTTTELMERVLAHCGKRTVAAGNIGLPLCEVAERTPSLDVLTLEVSSFQLETIRFFRPHVAALMNITPDHLDRYAGMEDYTRAKARVFENQQATDWAVIQLAAWRQLQALKLTVPSRVITFSATEAGGDLYCEGNKIFSRLKFFAGPLLDLGECLLQGPHNAENIMAVLATGLVLKLPVEQMAEEIKRFRPAPHRCELVAEINGVRYVNDSKATNVDAVEKALLAVGKGSSGPNIWVIAGGKDKGFGYGEIGPVLTARAKGAFLIGETSEKIRAAWSPYVPCEMSQTLEQAVVAASKVASRGEAVLLSPACSSFDQFKNYQHRGDVFREAVEKLKTQ